MRYATMAGDPNDDLGAQLEGLARRRAEVVRRTRSKQLGFVPVPVVGAVEAGSQVIGAVGGLLHIGGGANPSLRPQHKALIDFLANANDRDGLNHILTATFMGSSQMLYPTATLAYARQALGAMTGQVAGKSVLQALADAFNAAPLGTGAPYHQWEIDRINADLAAASTNAPGSSSGMPVVSLTQQTAGVSDTARAMLQTAITRGLINPDDAAAVSRFLNNVASGATDVASAAQGARTGAMAGATLATLPAWLVVGLIGAGVVMVMQKRHH